VNVLVACERREQAFVAGQVRHDPQLDLRVIRCEQLESGRRDERLADAAAFGGADRDVLKIRVRRGQPPRSRDGLVVTVDIRRGVTRLDDQLLRWLESRRELPVAVLLTKADKLSRGAGLAVERQVTAALGPTPLVTRFSAPTQDGVEAARGWLDSWLDGK